MSGIHRSLMLQVIGQLWVEYLTSVEALRTSIGLEAYAQRDPLVAYKSKATDMFRELLANVRSGVIARALQLRPRVQGAATQGPAGAAASAPQPPAPTAPRRNVLDSLATPPPAPALPQLNPNAGRDTDSATTNGANGTDGEQAPVKEGGGRRRRRRNKS
jgi:preprotein translocase subunit SecA